MCISSGLRAVSMSRHGMGVPYGQDKLLWSTTCSPPCGSGLTYIYIAWPSHHAGASWLSSPTAEDAGASSDLQENPSYAPSWGLPALPKVFLLRLDPAQPSQEETAYTSRAASGRRGNLLSG